MWSSALVWWDFSQEAGDGRSAHYVQTHGGVVGHALTSWMGSRRFGPDRPLTRIADGRVDGLISSGEKTMPVGE